MLFVAFSSCSLWNFVMLFVAFHWALYGTSYIKSNLIYNSYNYTYITILRPPVRVYPLCALLNGYHLPGTPRQPGILSKRREAAMSLRGSQDHTRNLPTSTEKIYNHKRSHGLGLYPPCIH